MQGQAFHVPQNLHLVRRQEIVDHLGKVGRAHLLPAGQAGPAVGPEDQLFEVAAGDHFGVPLVQM